MSPVRPHPTKKCRICGRQLSRQVKGEFCATHKRGLPADRFWSGVDKNGPTMPHMESPCWIWTRSAHPGRMNYGRIGGLNGKRDWQAHRFSYVLAHGPIPEGQCVLHRCDNPPCVRPDHLFVGTYADNNADMAAKRRSTRGERNPAAKLTHDEVREIRLALKTGASQRAVARRFGVDPSAISNIHTGRNWRDA